VTRDAVMEMVSFLVVLKMYWLPEMVVVELFSTSLAMRQFSEKVSANGNRGCGQGNDSGGGGAGGSVWIIATSLTVSNTTTTISAKGGLGGDSQPKSDPECAGTQTSGTCDDCGGGGAGGFIYIQVPRTSAGGNFQNVTRLFVFPVDGAVGGACTPCKNEARGADGWVQFGSENEWCNGVDDTYDGLIDEDLPLLDCGLPSCVNGKPQTCPPVTTGTTATTGTSGTTATTGTTGIPRNICGGAKQFGWFCDSEVNVQQYCFMGNSEMKVSCAESSSSCVSGFCTPATFCRATTDIGTNLPGIGIANYSCSSFIDYKIDSQTNSTVQNTLAQEMFIFFANDTTGANVFLPNATCNNLVKKFTCLSAFPNCNYRAYAHDCKSICASAKECIAFYSGLSVKDSGLDCNAYCYPSSSFYNAASSVFTTNTLWFSIFVVISFPFFFAFPDRLSLHAIP